jgi:hypothetical protein
MADRVLLYGVVELLDFNSGYEFGKAVKEVLFLRSRLEGQ